MPPSLDSGVLILGGGLAGASVAIHLARAGCPVTLVEQAARPHHKVCGEFLSAEALVYLDQLGLQAAELGAVPLSGVRFAAGQTLAGASLPFTARSLTRLRLDAALLELAALSGVRLLYGEPVDRLEPPGAATGRLWQATLRSGQVLTARAAVLATGKHDLRGRARPAGRQPSLLAFKQYFTLSPAQEDALGQQVELHLFPGGYAGLQPVEPDPETAQPRANLCLVVEQARFRQAGGSWPALLSQIQRNSPLLESRLAGAVPLLPRPLALSHIPYGLLPEEAPGNDRTAADRDELWRVGDQTAVIPSFTGDGMSIALHTASRAAALLLAGATAAELRRELQNTLRRQVLLAAAVSRLLVSPPARALGGLARPLLPAVLPWLARATRVPPEALQIAPPELLPL